MYKVKASFDRCFASPFAAILFWLFSKCHVIKISKIFGDFVPRDSSLCQSLLPSIRHFENRRGKGPGDEVGIRAACQPRPRPSRANPTWRPHCIAKSGFFEHPKLPDPFALPPPPPTTTTTPKWICNLIGSVLQDFTLLKKGKIIMYATVVEIQASVFKTKISNHSQ